MYYVIKRERAYMDSINKIFQITEYMSQHIEDELTLDDFCAVSGYTKTYLCYMFKLYIGETPHKYFYKQKLKYGAKLLFSCENVLDIALKIGFGSHESFSRAFKKEYGMTPTEYQGLHINGLSKLEDLSDIELIVLFSPSPAYRVFLGLDQYGEHYNVYQSLMDKGFISRQVLEPTIEGMQLRDKYLWDCEKIIVELSKLYNTLSELYVATLKLTYIPKLLFFSFLYDLVNNGMIRNVFLGRCGCNCFKCDTLKTTIHDNYELRKQLVVHSRNELNIEVDYTQMNCFGCTSDDRYESYISNCSWSPCCEKHSTSRMKLDK
jgi:AraC-like DNA-binding protein